MKKPAFDHGQRQVFLPLSAGGLADLDSHRKLFFCDFPGFLQSLDFIQPDLMAASLIFTLKPLIHNHKRQVFSHHAAAHDQHVGVVVLAGEQGGIGL